MIGSLRDEIDRLELLHAAHPNGRVFTHLAEAYRKAGELERARETVERGLELHPDYSSAHVVLGRILLDLEDRAGAERAFRRVLDLDPENRVALRALADLLRDDGRRAESLGYYREILLLDPTDETVEAMVRSLEAADGTFAPDGALPAPAWPAPEVDGASPENEGVATAIAELERETAGPALETGVAGPDPHAAGVVAEPIAEKPPPLWGRVDAPVDTPESGGEGAFDPVVTETMAELYAGQGLYARAAEVYRELLRTRPGDERLRAKLREAESRAARDRFVDDRPVPPDAATDEPPLDSAAPAVAAATPWTAASEAPVDAGPRVPAEPRPVARYFRRLLAFTPPRAPAASSRSTGGSGMGRTGSTRSIPWEIPIEIPSAELVAPSAEGLNLPGGSSASRAPSPPEMGATAPEPAARASRASRAEATAGDTAAARTDDPVPSAVLVRPAPPELALVDLLVGLLEYRDPFFRGGSSLTRIIATAIGREMGLRGEAISSLALAAVIRDLGRLALGGRLVKQPRPDLGPEARRRIEDHIDLALQLLEGIQLPPGVLEAVRHHHERWDGGGYPDGLAREEIPLAARILAVADSLAAMISPRPYRLPRRLSAAIDELRAEAGTRYDPAVVDALLRTLPRRGPNAGLRHYTIIVHPDQPRATVLAAKLCSYGYVAEPAIDLAVARDRLKRIPVELLVLSAELPDNGAATFLREIREAEGTAALPIVVVDADTVERRVHLLEAGADVCFPRGVSFLEIQATLGALMKRSARIPADAAGVGSGAGGSSWYALQGDIQDFPLSWLLQVLTYDGRTAAIVMRDRERGEEGVIYLDQGVARHARTRTATGEDALRVMLGWTRGSFVVRPEMRTAERSIDRPLMHLLLDLAVADDHASAIFGAVKPE
jgi:tetratricopeptide (TPR) repeat protein